MDFEAQFLITGTRRPVGVSIATPMLWLLRTRSCGLPLSSEAGSILALRSGYCCSASETALVMKGRNDSLATSGGAEVMVESEALRRDRSAVSAVMSMESA